MAKRNFGQFAIHDAAMNFAGGGESVRVDIFGAIGWDVYADEFLSTFGEIDANADIDLRIHSYGGSVMEGWAIAQAIKLHKGEVVGTVIGTAASMASAIWRSRLASSSGLSTRPMVATLEMVAVRP